MKPVNLSELFWVIKPFVTLIVSQKETLGFLLLNELNITRNGRHFSHISFTVQVSISADQDQLFLMKPADQDLHCYFI